ncbi:hypothetical protein [Streptomyces cavernae]|uniref:hypothetical protein n=1 Tax=Streptomyces cavernae TaxID=2259034 RepID=UPI000FEBEFB9|nr:hypothetical protein [Streptomyces cavernae]
MTDDRGERFIGGVWTAANSDNTTAVRSADTQQVIGALSKATTAHGNTATAVARCAYDAPAVRVIWDPKRQFEAFFTAPNCCTSASW